MDICSLLVVLAVSYIIVQLVRFLFADCDLSLQWASKFGKPPGSLKGKVVWISGASSGIGEYLACGLAANGCRLVLSARRKSELERVKEECLVTGCVKSDDILILPLDLLETEKHEAAVQEVLSYFNKIDVLVNNAGRSQKSLWKDTSLDVDRALLELNVVGTLSLTKQVLPHMMERKQGQIVVVSSIAGKLGAPFSGSYSGTKHALQGYFDTLRIEAYPDNIQILTVCPGPVFSNILKHAFTGELGKSAGVTMNPKENRVSTSRCAYLIAVAMANSLDEVWISRHPVLLFTYLTQYFPTIGKRLACILGMKQLLKIRYGK